MSAAKSERNMMGVIELFKKSYALVSENINIFAILYAIPAAITVAGIISSVSDTTKSGWDVSKLVSNSLFGPDVNDTSWAGAGVLALLLLVATGVVGLMTQILVVRVAQGHKPTLSKLWDDFKRLWWRLLLVDIAVGLIVVFGFILLIVPGVIFLWRLYLSAYVMIDKNLKVNDAMQASWEMTKGHFGSIYAVILFGVLLSLTGIIPLVGGAISLLLGAAYSVAPVLRYFEIKK